LAKVRTIQLKDETKHRLERLGRKGDTYDDIIRKLINSYTKNSDLSRAAEN
jgi:predicted CopG family antitoxin